MRCWSIPPLVFVARAIARLPQGAFLPLGRVLAVLLWPLLARRRRIARANIDLCFPQLDARARRVLLRDVERATVQGALELLRAWYAPDDVLEGLADVDGLEHLHAALARGQGVLLFTGHFTHTELCVRLLSLAAGRRIGVVVRHNNSACLEAAFADARGRAFDATLEKKDVRGLIRQLRGGGMVAYSADQDFNYQHVFVPFFGVPAATLVSTPELVRRAGTTMLSFFFHRDDAGRYQLQLRPAWPGWLDGTPEEAAAIYMRELESYVRQHPSQYLWVHRRFKTRPPGAPPVY